MHWQDFAIGGGLFVISVGVFLLIGYRWYIAIPLAVGVAIVGWGIGRMGAPS